MRNGFFRIDRRRLRDQCGSLSSGKIARGSGEHQTTTPRLGAGHGKMPCRYAASSVPGAKSAPTPTTPSRPVPRSAGGNEYREGGTGSGFKRRTTTENPHDASVVCSTTKRRAYRESREQT